MPFSDEVTAWTTDADPGCSFTVFLKSPEQSPVCLK